VQKYNKINGATVKQIPAMQPSITAPQMFGRQLPERFKRQRSQRRNNQSQGHSDSKKIPATQQSIARLKFLEKRAEIADRQPTDCTATTTNFKCFFL
jgi:hypothetical protein